jgi:hypothetical protein
VPSSLEDNRRTWLRTDSVNPYVARDSLAGGTIDGNVAAAKTKETVMSRTTLLLAFVLSSASLAACSETQPPVPASARLSSAASGLSYADVVGTWHFVYSDARRAAVEADLAAKISDPGALATAKKEAEVEAAASEIELTSDYRFLSRIDGKEILAATVVAKATDDGRGLELSSPARKEMSLRLFLSDSNTLSVMDPRKGELAFVRRLSR